MQNDSHNPVSTSLKKKAKKSDFRVENHGSICLIVPLSTAGIQWIEVHIGADNGYQPYYPTAIIEPRYLNDVLVGIRQDGLVAR